MAFYVVNLSKKPTDNAVGLFSQYLIFLKIYLYTSFKKPFHLINHTFILSYKMVKKTSILKKILLFLNKKTT